MILLIGIRTAKIFFIVASVFLILSAGSAAARRITVGDGDYRDYSSIQAAVDAATAGDIVYVYSGLYMENVDLEKEITIRSISGTPENFIIKAKDPGDHVFHVKANNVTISGFSIKGASDPEKAGIFLESTRGTMISNNRVSDNRLGIYLSDSNTNMLNVNNVSGNGVGIYLHTSQNNWVINNKATGNVRDGIFLQASDENRLTGNILLFNEEFGLMLSNSSKNLIYNNFFQNAANVGYDGTNLENIWNTEKRRGISIAGGPYTGGNYWTDTEKTALCTEEDKNDDGLCDVSYDLGEGNIDHLPLIRSSTRTVSAPSYVITLPLLAFAILTLWIAIFVTKRVMGWGDELDHDFDDENK